MYPATGTYFLCGMLFKHKERSSAHSCGGAQAHQRTVQTPSPNGNTHGTQTKAVYSKICSKQLHKSPKEKTTTPRQKTKNAQEKTKHEKLTHKMSFPAYFLTSVTSTFRLAASACFRAAASRPPVAPRRLAFPAPDTMLDAAFLPKIPARTCSNASVFSRKRRSAQELETFSQKTPIVYHGHVNMAWEGKRLEGRWGRYSSAAVAFLRYRYKYIKHQFVSSWGMLMLYGFTYNIYSYRSFVAKT